MHGTPHRTPHALRRYAGNSLDGWDRPKPPGNRATRGHLGIGSVFSNGEPDSGGSRSFLGISEAAIRGRGSALRIPGDRLFHRCGVQPRIEMVRTDVPAAASPGSGKACGQGRPAGLQNTETSLIRTHDSIKSAALPYSRRQKSTTRTLSPMAFHEE